MGRTAPPPPLLSHPERPSSSNANRHGDTSALKRPRSRSPPAGLLKRKANFNAVVPPPLAAANPKDGESSDNVAPGAPLPPKVETMQSPVMRASRLGSEPVAATALPSSRPGSALPSTAASTIAATSTSAAAAATAADANYNATCEALDDFTLPTVRLSCLPRKLPSAPPLSGRERRKARKPLPPLNQRKFYGCSSLDDYEISIKLGQGTFGEVLKGRQILTGTQVALKKVTIHDAKDGLPITALREIKLLKKLQHPSIVPVIDMAFRPSGERGKLGDVYMVEPYMDHDLNGMLENPSIRLEHSQIKLYMKQLLEGTLYLHKNRILHRDMKAANLLINNKGQLQIADFGLARPYRDPGQSWTGKGWQGGTHKYTNMVVTRWYRPPELLAGEKKYGPPIDMWGIGCILAEMIIGRPLFKGTSEINQLELIAKLCGSPNETSFPGWSSLPGVKDADPMGRPDPHPEVPGQHGFGEWPRKIKDFFTSFPYDAGPGCADLIDKLLVLDPKRRLTAQQALEHEWLWSKPYPADPASLPVYEHSKEIDRVRREWKPAPQVAATAPGNAAGAGWGRSQQPQPYGAAGAAGANAGMIGGPQQQQQQQRFPRPAAVGGGGGYAHPNGGGGAQTGAAANAADGWDQPLLAQNGPGMRTAPVPVPAGASSGAPGGIGGGGIRGSRPFPIGQSNNKIGGGGGGGGGSGRHPFPHPPSQARPPVRPSAGPTAAAPGGAGRFSHPNSSGRHAYPHHRPYPPRPEPQQQHGLPARPLPPAHLNEFRGAPNGGGANAGASGGGSNPYSF